MPSPFPGMNPYFETADSWRDFHNNFLMTLQKVLAEKLSERYFVKCEVRVVFHERSAEERFSGVAIADAGVLSDDHPRPGPPTATITAPVRLTLPAVEEERERWLEVVEGATRRVETVIELLSPSNNTNGRAGRNISPKDCRCCEANRTSLKLIFVAAGGVPRRRNCPSVTTACWSAGGKTARAWESGRSVCGTNCPRSPFPCWNRMNQ